MQPFLNISRLGSGVIRISALWLLLTLGAVEAAQPKPWVALSNCTHVAGDFNDADSFRIRSGPYVFIVRLYFVDAPESNLTYAERVREQSEHFGVTLDDTLKAGAKARERVRDLLSPPFIVRTRWATAPGRSKEPRHYGFVEVAGKNLAEILVSEGLARTKGVTAHLPTGEKSKDFSKRLQALELEAKEKNRGIWAASTPKKSAATSE